MCGSLRLVLCGCLLVALWQDSVAVSRRLKPLILEGGGKKTGYIGAATTVVDRHIPTLYSEKVSQQVSVATNIAVANLDNLYYSWSLD